MGISTRKDDQRAAFAAGKVAAEEQRAALAVVEAWNARLANKQPTLCSPTIHAALVSEHHWLHVICPACQIVAEIDLRVVQRDPALTIAEVLPSLTCSRCQPRPPAPRPLRLSTTFQVDRLLS